jgi:hypothetical protein
VALRFQKEAAGPVRQGGKAEGEEKQEQKAKNRQAGSCRYWFWGLSYKITAVVST